MTTVLVVDDDGQLLRVVARVLAQHGFESRIATNAADALAVAKTEPPDVVILDINIGTESGLELGRAIRASADRLPAIVFMTGRRDVFPSIVAELGPADDWITKPWDSAELLARVRLATKRTSAR
jgi:DNA-binding response OmpR family regulator